MADRPQTFTVEYDLRPTYYDQFRCLAGACRYTCCKGWHVTFNKKDYLALKRVEGSPQLNETLQSTVRRVKKGPNAGRWYGEFRLPGGCCPLQREDGLCTLQLEKGQEALPVVCRVFPRGKTYSDAGYLERTLSPACEGVLELLWNLPDGVDFVSDPLPRRDQKDGTFVPSAVLAPYFQDVRSLCIDLLQDRRYPLAQRILLIGLALKDLEEGDGDVEGWLARTQALADAPETAQLLHLPDSAHALSMFLMNNVKLMLSTTVRVGDFATVPEEVLAGFGGELTVTGEHSTSVTMPAGPYEAARARFEENFRGREYFLENLMVSQFYSLQVPNLGGGGKLWKSYVDFCNLYSFFRFMAVASCREGAAGDKDELFRMIVCASRGLLHNTPEKTKLRDEFFQNDSATLAHMAILLSG